MGSLLLSFRKRADVAFLASLAWIPALATAPGVRAADTKLYLHTNPGSLLTTAASLWDPQQFGGYVTHQTIGYLWPMGPWFWLMDAIGCPDWVAQRLWIGLLIFLAGTGVRFLARQFGLARLAALCSAAVYMLSPYLLTYVNRTSVLLSPWAGLGWLTGLTIVAARSGGWRAPAAAGLVIGSIGGINATAIALIGIAPVLWLVTATANREITAARAVSVAARIGLFGLGASLWWLVALGLQSRYGADVLAYSETVQAVASTASAAEVQRGLGHWLFYGNTPSGPWNSASTPYLQSPGLIALGWALASMAVFSLVVVRSRLRLWLAGCWLIGTALAVGSHDPGSPLGRLWTANGGRSTVQLALRSSTRAVPLVVLAMSLSLGTAIGYVYNRRPRAGRALAYALLLAVCANQPTLWNGSLVDATLRHPGEVPQYWLDAANELDSRGGSSRVLSLPGIEFGAFTWGTTTDSLLPGLMRRGEITRELLPLGDPAVMDLLYAFDDQVQQSTLSIQAVVPIARLLGAGDIVVRGDLDLARYNTVPPDTVSSLLAGSDGVGPPSMFGAVTIYPLTRPFEIVRLAPKEPVVLVGDGSGIVAAAAAGVLPSDRVIQYAGDGAKAPTAAAVIVTDTNRPRARQWRGSHDTVGATEDSLAITTLPDPADARLPLFGVGTERTTAEQIGGRATATSYGDPVGYRPEDRPIHAVDNDTSTWWKVGRHAAVHGERFEVEYTVPRPAGLVVRQLPDTNRMITKVRITTDTATFDRELDLSSRTPTGQRLDLGAGEFGQLSLEIIATDVGSQVSYVGIDAVGLQLETKGPTLREEVVVPATTLNAALQAGRPTTVVLTRERGNQRDPSRTDPEPTLSRRVTIDFNTEFHVTGTMAAPTVRGCRTDIVTLDGVGINLSVDATGRLSTCDELGLALLAGEHRFVSAPGVDLRQLVLTTADQDPPAPGAAGAVTIRSFGATHRHAVVGPFTQSQWLVLGEGWNRGWRATIDGEPLGPPQRVDGGSMGWRIAAGATDRQIELRWTPQRLVTGGQLASVLTAIASVAVVLVGRRRRQVPGDPGLGCAMTSSTGRRRLFTGALSALAAAIVVAPTAGLVVGAIVAASALHRWLRRLPGAAAVVMFCVSGLGYVVRQIRDEPAAGFGWVQPFERAHRVVLMAIVLLLAEVLLSRDVMLSQRGAQAKEKPGLREACEPPQTTRASTDQSWWSRKTVQR